MKASSSAMKGERFWEEDVIPYRVKGPSSSRILHFPQAFTPPQSDSIATPRPLEASRTVFPSSISPLRPEG